MKIVRTIISVCMCAAIALTVLLSFNHEKAYAGTWDDAYTYYRTYGNDAVFDARSPVNGYIFCATKGNASTSSTRYRTIGWKMTFTDADNNTLQVVYFKLNGNYMKLKNSKTKDGYKYALYALPLSKLKERLNSDTLAALNRGECKLRLDACMVVAVNGKAGGAMNDTGIKSGAVYTTYAGIKSAANWSDAAKNALKSYFNKSIRNLFYTVNIACGTGIKSVKGSGVYCYGTLVTVTASLENGYQFEGWTPENGDSLTYSFYASQDVTLTANAKPISVNIIYHRNHSESDSKTYKQIVYYTVANQKIERCIWTKGGYHFDGWADSWNGAAAYTTNQAINKNWISSNAPTKNLYAKWKPNEYTIHFFGPKAETLSDINVKYTDEIQLPGGDVFRGFSINSADVEPAYAAGSKISIKSIVRELGLQNQNNSVIYLYTFCYSIPVINAGDLYYSVEDAKVGSITESEIASHASAYDELDGTIAYGVNSNNSFRLVNYNADSFSNIDTDAVIDLTFEAKNSSDKVTTQDIKVYVCDTKEQTSEENIGRIRFISKKYFVDENGEFVNENAGGLIEDSCWKNNTNYFNILMNALGA